MARKYDRMIRFYDSWFADFCEESKALSGDEFKAIILAIVECQRTDCTEPMEELPLTIRRALQMATLREQIERMIERSKSQRKKAAKGGQVTNQYNAEERAIWEAEKAARAEAAENAKVRAFFMALPPEKRKILVEAGMIDKDGNKGPAYNAYQAYQMTK